MAAVELVGVAKRFDDTEVVRDVSLSVAEGEVVALLGPSGSGKTTTLRLIAGFEPADSGRIVLAGRDVTAIDALNRRCGMVFQHYALFPHLTAGQNVGYGLAGTGLDAGGKAGRIAETLELVDMAGYQDRPVTALSGGQQQRVALARALAPEPAVLLLDEPLSNLDPTLRDRTRRELSELVRRIGITTVLVTHEQEEAFELADRVALLLDGTLAQVDTPEGLYRSPASMAVAGFIGRCSRIPGQVVSGDGDHLVIAALGANFRATGSDLRPGDAVTLMVRPEGLALDAEGPVLARVVRRRFVGSVDMVHLDAAGVLFEVETEPLACEAGAEVRLAPTGFAAHAFADPA